MKVMSAQAMEFKGNDGDKSFKIPGSGAIVDVPDWVKDDDYFKGAKSVGVLTVISAEKYPDHLAEADKTNQAKLENEKMANIGDPAAQNPGPKTPVNPTPVVLTGSDATKPTVTAQDNTQK